MARRAAERPGGLRLVDGVTAGLLAKAFPLETVHAILADTGRASQRERELPAHVMVYYVIALSLYMPASYGEVLRALLEGARWLAGPDADVHTACRSAISQARTRLGEAPLQQLFARVVRPVAAAATPGAFYRHGDRAWRTVSLDGTTFDIADTAANAAAFGRPAAPLGAQGRSAYPQVRLVGLLETGTRVVFAAALGTYHTSEATLAPDVLPALAPGMLCLADRFFTGFDLWQAAAATGADLLWRIRKNARLPVLERYPDGSYRSELRANWHCRATDQRPLPVRVIEYQLPHVPDAEPVYRLVTTLRDPTTAPAAELAALYRERWEVETALDEIKTHLKGAQLVLRSKTPELVRQEVYGLLLAHYAVRGLLHEAALGAPEGPRDPDTLSFVHATRVVRRGLPRFAAVPPSGSPPAARGAARGDPRGAGHLQPRPHHPARRQTSDRPLPAPTSGPPTKRAHRLRRRGL
jgi:hypothetical protein